MEFNIGDRVRVKNYEDLPESMKSPRFGTLCGKDGEIVDKLWSGARGCTVYKIHFDGAERPSSIDFLTKAIDLIADLDKKVYRYELDCLDNMVVAVMYEVGDDYKTEIARGRGHIIHEGAIGIAQAASYALKKIYQKLSEQH